MHIVSLTNIFTGCCFATALITKMDILQLFVSFDPVHLDKQRLFSVLRDASEMSVIKFLPNKGVLLCSSGKKSALGSLLVDRKVS